MQDQERRHEFRCVACGFGARRSAAPVRCPMCGSGVWKLIGTLSHPLSHADLPARPVEVAATQ